MSQEAKLRAERRGATGSAAARRLRRAGRIPASLYGDLKEAVKLTVDGHEFSSLLAGVRLESTPVELESDDGTVETVLVREIQRHPWRPEVLHVDLLRIRADRKVRVTVPIRIEGIPTGVRNEGGMLQQIRYELEVECLPSEIPEEFAVDVNALAVGDSLHVADLPTGGVRPLEDLELTLVTVLSPTVSRVEGEEEEGEELEAEEGEPEVIGRTGDAGDSEPEE